MSTNKLQRSAATRPKPSVVTFIVCAAVILLFLSAYVGYMTVVSTQSQGIRKRLDGLRNDGIPSSAKELSDWYVESLEGENAAPIYEQAFDAFVEPDADTNDYLPTLRNRFKGAEPLSAEVAEAIAGFVQSNARAIALLHKAAGIKNCTYPLDLSQGLAAPLTHLSKIRQAAWLAGLAAVHQAINQRSGEATSALIDQLQVSNSLSGEPILISQLVRFVTFSIFSQTVAHCLTVCNFTDEDLRMLQTALGRERVTLKNAFIGERVFGSDVFLSMAGGNDELGAQLGLNNIAVSLFPNVILQHDHSAYLDDLQQIVDAFDLPENRRLQRFKQIDKAAEDLGKTRLISAMLLPAVVRAAIKELIHLATFRACSLILAIERYRLRNGKPPTTLEELCPEFLKELPLDPFTGRNLVYKVEERTYLVYSVSENLLDDGGDIDENPFKDVGIRIGLEPAKKLSPEATAR